MPQESPKNNKKTRFDGRRRSYVDTFRWGFVPDDATPKQQNDEHGNQDSNQSAEGSNAKRTRARKKSAKKTVTVTKKTTLKVASPKSSPKAVPKTTGERITASRPVKKRSRKNKELPDNSLPAHTPQDTYREHDDDLTLPSYGRTPVPLDDELPQPQKITPKAGRSIGRPARTAPPKTAPPKVVPKTRDRKPVKSKIAAVPPVASKPAAPPSADVPFTEVTSGGFRPRREQMVWDADKAEYVPLVIPAKELTDSMESCRPKKRSTKKTAKRAETAKTTPPKTKCADDSRADADVRDQPPPAPAKQSKRYKEPRGNPPKFVKSLETDPTDVEAEASGFVELGVSGTMLEALRIVRYLEPTPIQAGVFKMVRAGTDLMGQARTGTGKTAAFSMPIIEGIETCPPGDDPVAIILVPTRELAVQVRDEAIRLAYGQDIRITACYGGKPLGKQIERLKAGIDILVGTPGRILDLMNRRALSLDAIRWAVLDEADRMLDIGFRPDIEKILKRTPQDRQTLLFSATLPPPVVRLAEKYMKSPEILDFSNKSVAVDTIEQFYVTVDPERKFDALVYLLQEQSPQQAIIFTRTKRGADRLARLLDKRFEKLAAIHGDMQQSERDRVMAQVRAGSVRYLVATDVVGRGIDVSSVSHIINYDIPKFCDDYIHRVGRTGRMGRDGVAYTFVTVQEGAELTRIEMRIDKLLQRAELKGFESFTKPHDPNASLDDEDTQPEPSKPVFGKPVRRVRRAL